jgi:hypothetical protein
MSKLLNKQSKFSYMQENTVNFMVDPSMLIDVANNVVGSGGHMLADAGGFLQQHANPIIMGISGILGTKARGNAAVKTAEAGAKIAEDITKAKAAGQAAGQRAGLLKGVGLGVTGGIAGGALLNHGLNKNDY